MARAPYRTGRAALRRRQTLYAKFGIGGAVFFVLVIGLALFLRQESMLISQFTFSGLEVVKEVELRSLVETELRGTYLFLVPRASTFFYPSGRIKKVLLQIEKRIQDVEITRDELTRLHITVHERKPEGLWCYQEGESCFFLDDGGYIFASSPIYTGNVYFRYFGNVDGDPIGHYFLPTEEFKTLSFFIVATKNLGLSPTSLTLLDDEFSLTLKEGGRVIFVRGESLDRILDALSTALMSPTFKEKDLATLEYIDLRFPNKVIYKWRVSAE